MPLNPDQLKCIPLLQGLSDQQLLQLSGVFEQRTVAQGTELFRAGKPAEAFYLLAGGEVTIFEGEDERYRLHPPAPIGELGALAGLKRNTTALVTQTAEIWQVTRDAVLRFFEGHQEVALPFYQNLTLLIADKVRRDQLRLEDMRRNIIRTQKVMKQMRDFLLEAEDTPVSETLHNKLEDLIAHNRRVNYRVRPPETLTATVKLASGDVLEVEEISRTHLSFLLEDGPAPADDSVWSGVLRLGGPEIPISGTVLRTLDRRVDIKLDLLIEDYGAILDGYLTRVQMLNFMV